MGGLTAMACATLRTDCMTRDERELLTLNIDFDDREPADEWPDDPREQDDENLARDRHAAANRRRAFAIQGVPLCEDPRR